MTPAARSRQEATTRSKRPRPVSRSAESADPDTDRIARVLRERYGLTRAEIGVAMQVREGLSYQEMAESLGVSYHTVHSHVKAIHSKTGVRSNGRLMALIRDGVRPPS